MSDTNLVPYLLQMIDAAARISRYTHGMSEADFLASTLVQDAVCMNLEVIGEVANRLPAAYQEANGEVDWRKIIALRHLIAHSYASVDLQRIWQIVTVQLPNFSITLHELLRKAHG
ncbi:MAG: DUF86 domain-containing protein [Bacteroidia bacterium]|nr:DUF86 domain-containing protein [Bacteroidia bacterium]